MYPLRVLLNTNESLLSLPQYKPTLLHSPVPAELFVVDQSGFHPFKWPPEGDGRRISSKSKLADISKDTKVSHDSNARLTKYGPALLEDGHAREKIHHFDYERIPEQIAHARGAGAFGIFKLYESAENVTSAGVLTDTSRTTPVFLRFSTILGSRGSADTVRDVGGFAIKFYTEEGNWDIVGNDIPVLFIQDAVKFTNLIHAAKPEPDVEVPQAQSAHKNFWDF
ncbi:MAG: hypothetical protein Q9175_005112 [Cornicularia normoerica]